MFVLSFNNFKTGIDMRLKNALTLTTTGLVCLLIVSCAKNNVKTTYEDVASGLPKPSTVLIYNFPVSLQAVQQSSSPISRLKRTIESESDTTGKTQLGKEVADALATELMKKIAALGLNPKRADESLSVAPGTIAITGQITNIDEGNSIRRNVIGFGAGQSSLDVNVSVLAPSSSGNKELIGFDAHADSGEKPGAVVLGPVGAAAGAGTAATVGVNVAKGAANIYKSASAHQAEDMADKITTELAKYFSKQGWISPDLAK
jgi:hypothetical protein